MTGPLDLDVILQSEREARPGPLQSPVLPLL